MTTKNYRVIKKQSGNATLAMSLVLLSVITLISVTSSKTVTNEIRMTSNSIEKQKSQIAAESAILQAWNRVNTFTKMDFLEPCNRAGIYDLRATATNKQCTTVVAASAGHHAKKVTTKAFTNKSTAWEAAKNPATWNWSATNNDKHDRLKDKLSIKGAQILSSDERTDPMKLFIEPQYAIAIHEPVYRAGSTQICFPVSIIGAAKGGVEETETLIEIRAIPANGCFPKI